MLYECWNAVYNHIEFSTIDMNFCICPWYACNLFTLFVKATINVNVCMSK